MELAPGKPPRKKDIALASKVSPPDQIRRYVQVERKSSAEESMPVLTLLMDLEAWTVPDPRLLVTEFAL